MPDYTKMRASSRIKICPKCQRKGKVAHIEIEQPRHGYKAIFDQFTHVSEISFMGSESVREHCTVNYRREPLLQKQLVGGKKVQKSYGICKLFLIFLLTSGDTCL